MIGEACWREDMKRKRRNHSAEFKAKVALAVKGRRWRVPALNLPEDDRLPSACLACALLRKQSGVRVSPAGHVKCGVEPPN